MMQDRDSRFQLTWHREVLSNGITLIVVPVTDTALVTVNLLYGTGSRDEDPERTGLAHLMEHLMFSGTKRFPAFDKPLAGVGGLNNAFTNQDITCYYEVLPAAHLELALTMEADRLQHIRPDAIRVSKEKDVVIEEFRQRYLNQPYGDLYHLLSAAAWKVHPYRWPTIGLDPSHIEKASQEEVEAFHKTHYRPANLTITIAGGVEVETAVALTRRHFEFLDNSPGDQRTYVKEPLVNRRNQVVVHREVPSPYLMLAYPVTGSTHPDYTGLESLSDILGQGIISRFHTALVRNRKLFSRISASLTGTIDPGLFTISGMLMPGVDSHQAVEAVTEVIERFVETGPTGEELKAVINGMITHTSYKRTNIMNLALEVALASFEGDIHAVNTLFAKARLVDSETLVHLAKQYLAEINRIEIHYLTNK
jgi:zinc protease